MNYFRKRRLLKSAKELLHHARHIRNMREDIMEPAELAGLLQAEKALADAKRARDMAGIETTRDELYRTVVAATPQRSMSSLRENLEIFAVAIAVAMAFRAYFLQPFKIPTGSMEPTLYGIQVITDATPRLIDRFPLKIGKWLVTGTWYTEVKAKADGYLSVDLHQRFNSDPTSTILYVGGKKHKVPNRGYVRVRAGEHVNKGTVLWSGMRTAGDHVLVDKIRWNLRLPRRGEVMVFRTDGIMALQQGTHYIKRMSGLPGEKVSIDPPNLVINGETVSEPKSIRMISGKTTGYSGYTLVDANSATQDACPLRSRGSVLALSDDEYVALGDNTMNSRDSRYWGPVPRQNLVGPAALVYWPFSKRWGVIR